MKIVKDKKGIILELEGKIPTDCVELTGAELFGYLTKRIAELEIDSNLATTAMLKKQSLKNKMVKLLKEVKW